LEGPSWRNLPNQIFKAPKFKPCGNSSPRKGKEGKEKEGNWEKGLKFPLKNWKPKERAQRKF